MYKLLIGNVKITVSNDTIERTQATAVARHAIATAQAEGKCLNHIQIDHGPDGLEISTTERNNHRAVRKTLKQSLLDGMFAAIQEKLFPSSTFSNKDAWYDRETGQEWRGTDLINTREDLMNKFDSWRKSI